MIIYTQVFTFQIGKLDEDHLITDKIEFLKNPANFSKILTTDAFYGIKSSNFYRPVQNLSYYIDTQIGGGDSWSYYISNILLHFLTCLILLLLLKKLKISDLVTFSLVLFFAVSPLFSHTVGWLPARGDLLNGLFGALGLLFLILLIDSKNWLYLLFHTISFAISVFSKETAILLPLLFIAFYFFIKKQNPNAQFFTLLAGYALVIIIFLSLRSQIASTEDTGNVFFISGLFSNLQVFPEFIAKFLIPYNLAPMPDYNIVVTIIGLISLACFIFLLLKFEPKKRLFPLFGLAWFIIFIVPGAMYVHAFKSAAYAYLEHRSYLPLIGILLALAYIWDSQKVQVAKQKISYLVFAMSFVYLIIAFVLLQDYKDPITFYNTAVEDNPKSAMAHYNRGIILKKEGKTDEAMNDYNTAISLKSDYAEALTNRGAVLKERGDFAGANEDFQNALKYKNDLPEAHYNIAMMYYSKGNYPEALQEADKAIALDNNLPDVYMLKGNIYFNRKEFKNALDEFSHAISLRPQDAGLYNNRGSAEFLAGKQKEAIGDFSKAVELKPDYADAFKNRGLAKNTLNDKSGACEDFQKAAQLGNKEAEMLYKQLCK